MYAAIYLRRDTSLVCHSERNEVSRKTDKRFGVSLGMTEERLSALSRFKWVAVYALGCSPDRGVNDDFGHDEDNTYCVLRIALKVTFNVTLKGGLSIDLAAGVHHGPDTRAAYTTSLRRADVCGKP